jgi:uncharacterized protein
VSVRLFVDAWDPSYGSAYEAAEAEPTAESTASVDPDVEVAHDSWRPLSPPGDVRAPGAVLLVDGVRRVDARIWVEEAHGMVYPGLAASYAAGVVRCDLRRGLAEVTVAKVARGLYTASAQAEELTPQRTGYRLRRTAATEVAQLSAAVQGDLHELEGEVSALARTPPSGERRDSDHPDLLVLDGPLRARTHLPRTLGYIKTHRVQYLSPALAAVITLLRPGQRTPLFLLGTSWHRFSWYLKLPGAGDSPWAGVVRVEASADLPRHEVIELADTSAVTLPRFASTAYKDPRAPQNLIPIAGLERRLRAMLGDTRLQLRALVAAAAAQRASAAV